LNRLAFSIEYRTTGWASRDDIQADEARVILVCGGPHVEVWYSISGYSTPDDAVIRGYWWGDEYLPAFTVDDYDALVWAFDVGGWDRQSRVKRLSDQRAVGPRRRGIRPFGKPTGPRGRFFFFCPWPVMRGPPAVMPWSRRPFSCTAAVQERALACNLAVIRGPLAVLFTWWSVRQRSARKVGPLLKQLHAAVAVVRVFEARPWVFLHVARGALAVVRWPPAVARGLVAPVFGCEHPNKARRPRAVACG
jgi:hypothetical protein